MLDPWYLDNIVCPRDFSELSLRGGLLKCASGHQFPVIDGMPVMLLDDVPVTANFVEGSLHNYRSPIANDRGTSELYLESLGINEAEKQGVVALSQLGGDIDPVVSYLVAATNGLMYRHLIGKLTSYPIPKIHLPVAGGRRMLDVGCSWGRWCLAASERGYDSVGIDPSLGAVMAARRVAKQLGRPTRYIVGDARYLPFPAESFDLVYSYSVIQHFSRANAAQSVAEMGRVLKNDGMSKVQMPTRFGIRCLYHQLRRGFRKPSEFEVRYWSLRELRRLFAEIGSEMQFHVDCYFGIGLQHTDAALMPRKLKAILWASEALKAVSGRLPALVWFADSVFAECVKETRTNHAIGKSAASPAAPR